MKLATYKDGSRDGQLVVVSRDLSSAHYATGIAMRLQQVLDDWSFLAPQLQDLSDQLNSGKLRHAFAFDPQQCMAPLPRAYQWAHGMAYLSHLAQLHPSGAGELPPGLQSELQMVQGASDELRGPCDPVAVSSEALGIDFGAGLAVATGDVARGVSETQALEAIRLVMLVNDVSLRQLMAAEQARGLAGVQSKPATAFSPVAVTPDELGDDWQGGRVHLTLQVSWNGRKVGLCETGPEMSFSFGQLIAHMARMRPLRAGTLVGSGPVSNAGLSVNGRTEWPRGYSAIAEKRAIELLQDGQASTEYMKFGDSLRIEMKGRDGQSLFGAIDQDITAADPR